MGKIQLSWVFVNNQLHHVKEFSHLKPSKRPRTICPVCNKQVVMRLGKIREFHAAHKPEDICVVNQPETALHLNAKLYFAQKLKEDNRLYYMNFCQGNTENICPQRNNRKDIYFEGWDEVLVEYHIDKYRPDIVLKKKWKSYWCC